MSQSRWIQSLNRLAISVACAAAVGAGSAAPAIAQANRANQVSSLETDVRYDEKTLHAFAAAAASVLALRGQYYPRIRAAELAGEQDKADQLFKQMRAQMHAAIRHSGFTADQYRAISQAAKTDAVLRGRINAILQGAPPAQQRIQNVTRVKPPAPAAAAAPAKTAPAPASTAPATPAPTPAPAQSAATDSRRLEAALNGANAERDRYRAAQAELQQKTEELERQLAAAKTQDTALREQLTAARAKAVAAQNKNKKQLETLSGEVASLKEELSTAQTRDGALREELAAERARADAEQSSKEAKLAELRLQIRDFAGRLATAQQKLDSLAVDLTPAEFAANRGKASPFEAIKPLRREPNSIERLMKKAGPQQLERLELENELAKYKQERLARKVERAVLQKEITELSRGLAATYQAMADLIGEPVDAITAATELDTGNETHTLDLSRETAQLFEMAPAHFTPAPAEPAGELLAGDSLALGGGDPVDQPGPIEPTAGTPLESGLAAPLRLNPAPLVQIVAAPAGDAGIGKTPRPAARGGSLKDGAAAYRAEDYRRAYEIWVPLAESGNAGAQFHLGALYFEGRGTDVDFSQSYFWLRLAAYQGDRRAPRLLQRVAQELSSDQMSAADAQAREWLYTRSIEITQSGLGSDRPL